MSTNEPDLEYLLITHWEGRIRSAAQKRAKRSPVGLTADDYYQAGIEGLINQYRKVNPDGFDFAFELNYYFLQAERQYSPDSDKTTREGRKKAYTKTASLNQPINPNDEAGEELIDALSDSSSDPSDAPTSWKEPLEQLLSAEGRITQQKIEEHQERNQEQLDAEFAKIVTNEVTNPRHQRVFMLFHDRCWNGRNAKRVNLVEIGREAGLTAQRVGQILAGDPKTKQDREFAQRFEASSSVPLAYFRMWMRATEEVDRQRGGVGLCWEAPSPETVERLGQRGAMAAGLKGLPEGSVFRRAESDTRK